MVSWLGILWAFLLQIAGYAVFLKGFFPPKVTLQDYNSFLDGSSPFATNEGPLFDRIIVMVVDAMRSDFMYSSSDSSMLFLHSLIRNGSAIPFTAFSNPPTVTLPRLKGITTGSTPSFIDAILNVADDKDNSQSLANTDSWIRQFKNLEGGRAIHFYGDDTWLKLFPSSEFFEASEGTNSFFVSDYTEVDFNVSRHLDKELSDPKWDALILHYLGMDHIGHKGGPGSPYMEPKQIEMDSIVERIFLSQVENSESTLMVLMGDHGMNEVGNHGGSSKGETSPGMVFISPLFRQITEGQPCPVPERKDFDFFLPISQIDIVPTIAALLNFPIPQNNLGVIIPSFLNLWTSEEQKQKVLLENAEQFLQILQGKFAKTDPELMAFQEELESLKQDIDLNKLLELLKRTQRILTESATNYSYSEMFAGIILIACGLLVTSLQLFRYFKHGCKMSLSEFILFPLFCVVYALHFHGSSLIEEEHHIWWFLTILSLVSLLLSQKMAGGTLIVSCLFILRIVKAWNNSGQKFSSPFTIASYLSASPNILWALIIISYLTVTGLFYSEGEWIEIFGLPGIVVRKHRSNDLPSLISFVVAYVTGSLSFLFKLSQHFTDGNELPSWLESFLKFVLESFGATSLDDKLVLQSINIQISRLFAIGIASLFSVRILGGRIRNKNDFLITDLLNLATLALMHQSRAENIPVFLLFNAARFAIGRLMKSEASFNADFTLLSVTALLLCLQNFTFFSLGNTNLLATVDLSNAYNGVANYDVLLVAILTFISNFASSIYWSFATLHLLFENGSSRSSLVLVKLVRARKATCKELLSRRTLILQFFYGVSMTNLVMSCVNLRYHLFIWSVFCPKLLYFLSWLVLVNFGIDFVLALLVLSVK